MADPDSQDPPPVVSVIIPVFGDVTGLPDLLEGLRRLQYPTDRFEVVLVDNHPRPCIALDDPNVRVVHQPVPGSYAARNAGVRASRGDVLAFTDADCSPDPLWLDRGTVALLRRPSIIVGGHILVVPSASPSVAELLECRSSLQQRRYVDEGYAATANLFIRRDDLEGLGGFNQDLRSGGDRDLGYRAVAMGLTYEFADDAIVRHRARTTIRSLIVKSRRVTAGSVEVLRLNGGRGAIVRHLWRSARPPVRSVTSLLRDRSFSPVLRLQISGATLVIYVANLWFTLRRIAPAPPPPPRA